MRDDPPLDALLPLTAPRRVLQLGLVPEGYVTFAEAALSLERAALARLGSRAEAVVPIPQTLINAVVGTLVSGLSDGTIEAIVDFEQSGRLHRVPSHVWWQLASQVAGDSSHLITRFWGVITSHCMSGPEFGRYDGKTPCLIKGAVEKLLAERTAQRISALGQFGQLLPREPEPVEGEVRQAIEAPPNVPIGHFPISKWIILPAVDEAARRRVEMRGGDANEESKRIEIAQMAVEQGRKVQLPGKPLESNAYKWSALGAKRRAAGYKVARDTT